MSAAKADDGREIAVASAILRQQHQLHAVGKHDLGTADQLQSNGLGRHVRAHETGERTPIGDCQRRVAQRLGSLDQFFWMRGAAQKAEIGQTVQLGVVGQRHLVRPLAVPMAAVTRNSRAETIRPPGIRGRSTAKYRRDPER